MNVVVIKLMVYFCTFMMYYLLLYPPIVSFQQIVKENTAEKNRVEEIKRNHYFMFSVRVKCNSGPLKNRNGEPERGKRMRADKNSIQKFGL
jgi:hypothetical protein